MPRVKKSDVLVSVIVLRIYSRPLEKFLRAKEKSLHAPEQIPESTK